MIAWIATTSSALERIVNFLQVFWHLNYHILVFFLAYIGIYRTPAGWYGQEPYLGPAHLWLCQNMGIWDKKIAPKWGGTANAQFRFSVSYTSLVEPSLNLQWIRTDRRTNRHSVLHSRSAATNKERGWPMEIASGVLTSFPSLAKSFINSLDFCAF